jgi:hypothetical protein
VLTLLAKVCKLEMKVDATELVFDNCLVGGSYVKDFTIRNHSEIPLLFGIKTDSVPTAIPTSSASPYDDSRSRRSVSHNLRSTTELRAKRRSSNL